MDIANQKQNGPQPLVAKPIWQWHSDFACFMRSEVSLCSRKAKSSSEQPEQPKHTMKIHRIGSVWVPHPSKQSVCKRRSKSLFFRPFFLQLGLTMQRAKDHPALAEEAEPDRRGGAEAQGVVRISQGRCFVAHGLIILILRLQMLSCFVYL